MRLLTNEGARMKEENSSRAHREFVVEGEGGVPKLGLLEKSLVSMAQGVKRKRSRVVRSAKYDSTSARKEIIQRDNKQPMAANDKDDIRFQCRKRKCPGRTVVGYSLCEHHLGKMRLGSFNGVVVKGTKIKELRLIEAACKGVHKREDSRGTCVSDV